MYADPHTGDTGTAVCTVPTRTIGGTGKLERGKGVDSVEGGSSLRQKNTKNRRGWGNLPVNVLHIILSNAKDTMQLDNLLQQSWKNHPSACEPALAVMRRVWLCEMRGVSTGWRNAVDSHSFWPAYTLLLDPSKHLHKPTTSEQANSRLIPSTPTFSTRFHQSRHATVSACLACKFNYPSRVGLNPASFKRLTQTSKLGKAPTCEKHCGRYCMSCMKESAPRDPRTMTLSELNGVDCEQDLVRCHPRDVDEYGDQRGRFGGPVCRPCRRAALHAHLCIILTECANKGPVHGLHSIWWSLDRNNFAYENYVDDSVGTAAEMAHLVVEEHWLWDHTRWRELIHPACALQKDERRLRRNYLRGLGVANETDHLHRLSLQADIRGEEMFSFEQDDEEMMCLCREWDTEDKEGVDLADESSDDGNDFEENTLEPRIRRKLYEGVINDWANDRIHFGFWVAPSDEVRQLVFGDSAVHTQFQALASKSSHPFPNRTDGYTPVNAADAFDSLICLIPQRKDSTIIDPFLPPRRLLKELQVVFEQKLRSRIFGVLGEMVDGIRYSFATEEEADLNASKWDVKTVLAVMSRSTAWVHGELARTVARRYGGPEPASRKANIMEDPQVSPRVEVVQDDEMEDQDYGIQEVSSNAASPEEEPVDPRSRWPIQEESTAGQETQSIQRQKVFSGGNLNRPVELPTPEGSPNFGKRKLPPSPKIQHIDRTAPLPSPPDQPILFPDVSHKVRTSEHKPGFAPQHQNPDLRNDGKSSPQSMPASASTRSTISNEPLPTTPEDSDRRRPSDTSDTLLGEIFADAPSPISFYSDGSSIMTDTDSDASSLAPLSVGNKKRLITATAEIPWIPSSEHQLGPLATHMIMSAWYDARAKLRECRCSICLRAKKRTLEEALGWADAWVGEGGKKARLG